MPPLRTWNRGHEAISEFAEGEVLAGQWLRPPRHTKGQPAIGDDTLDQSKRSCLDPAFDLRTDRGGDRVHYF